MIQGCWRCWEGDLCWSGKDGVGGARYDGGAV